MAEMKCPHCTNAVSPRARECPSCGHPLRAVGLLGERGTAFGCANVGCAMLVIAALVLLYVAFG